MAHPMGESKRDGLRVDFDRRLKLEFHGSKITSDGGLLAYRELDDALGLTEVAGTIFQDSRTGKNGWHGMTGQFRQSVFGRLGGYEDVNDADRLGRDPAMRWIVGGKAVERQAASTSQMGRFETELLATDANIEVLAGMNGAWIDKVHDRRPPKMIILDMDSSVSPTHGEQEGTAYNGHFGCTCYHPLFLFNQFGDLERCSLRPGNVHSADGWREVLEPVVERYRERNLRRYFRGDAAFAAPDIYEFLESEGFLYAIRLPKNQILQESIAHLLTRPVGRPPNHVRRYYASFRYQAGSWDRKRRVVAKVEWRPGELCPRVGFIVTNLSRPAERVVAFYLTKTAAPKMLEQFGVGFDTAAEVLIAAGDNTDRIRSEAAFAKLCGVCPIPAGSGKTSGRHRLNRGGNRQANAALYRVVVVRLRWHPPTIAYVKRRKADGLSKKDIIRCLKRFVAPELYHLLPEPSLPLEPTSTPSPT